MGYNESDREAVREEEAAHASPACTEQDTAGLSQETLGTGQAKQRKQTIEEDRGEKRCSRTKKRRSRRRGRVVGGRGRKGKEEEKKGGKEPQRNIFFKKKEEEKERKKNGKRFPPLGAAVKGL